MELKFLHFIDGNVNWYRDSAKLFGSISNAKYSSALWSTYSTYSGWWLHDCMDKKNMELFLKISVLGCVYILAQLKL